MQKKHLHMLLTICFLMLLAGCGPGSIAPENLYLAGDSRLNIELPANKPASANWGSLSATITPPADSEAARLNATIAERIRVSIGLPPAGGTPDDSLRLSRSLMGLHLGSSAGAEFMRLVPLPRGQGFALWLQTPRDLPGDISFEFFDNQAPEGETGELSPKWVEAAENAVVWPSSEYGSLTIAATPVENLFAQVSAHPSFVHLTLPAGKKVCVVVAHGSEANATVELARGFLKTNPEKLASQARDSLSAAAAFLLQTEDDRTNRAFALLLARLVGAGDNPRFSDLESIAGYGELAAALALASRETPDLLFPGRAPALDRELDAFTANDRLLWSLNACRASLNSGLFSTDTLSLLQSRILSALAEVDAALATASPASLYPSRPDTAMQKVLADLWFADINELGSEISQLRGQSEAHDLFRKKSISAAKEARTAFQSIYYAWQRSKQLAAQPENKKKKQSEPEPDALEFPEDIAPVVSPPPDTLALIRAGARYGFNNIARSPAELMAGRAYESPEIWQRWISFRFADDSKLMSTSDYDSLLTVLLEGTVPGALTIPQSTPPREDLRGAAAALENFARTYLGVQPDWTRGKLRIDPRPPEGWRRTQARVPLGEGWLLLDYDLLHERMRIELVEIDKELDVVLRYPLPAGNALTTQFKLGPLKPRVTIHLLRETGNRLRLKVS